MTTSRFDVERAVLRSSLPAGQRHVMHVLCVRVDAASGAILPRWQPSLTELARDTGYHRRTIMRYLAGLERAGWVTRRRPPPALARTKHARTHYAVHIGPAEASDTGPPELVTGGPGAGGGTSPGLGAAPPGASGTPPRRSRGSSESSAEEIGAVIEAIRQRAGITVDAAWAERVAGQIIGARDRVRNPVAVIRAVIARAPRDTYAPTPQPPRFTAAAGFQR